MRLVVIFLIAGACFGQSQALKQYVGLTDPQAAAIGKLNSTYQSYASMRQQRVNTLNSELSLLYTKPAPDPAQLGVRYVELEAIRRDLAVQLTTLQSQVAALLTPAQVAQVQNLNVAAEAQPLISDARCGFLLDTPSSSQWFNTSQFVSAGVFGFYSGPSMPPAPSGSFCGSSVYPISVRQYLSLTDAEVSAFFNASAAYNDYYARKQNRIADLYVQIRDDTAKASPNAAVLGALYAELASIGQDIQNQGNQLGQTARAVLTPQQATQLKTLQNDVALQALIYEAENSNLLVLAPGTDGSSGAYYYGLNPTLSFPGKIVLGSPFTSSLQKYLGLTSQQIAAIHKLNADYQTYLSTEQSRMNTIDKELAALYVNAAPDANQLGARYVELESIRRDIATHLATLQTQDAAQLTKIQLNQIQTLNAAAVLQPLINDAQCGFLLDASSSPGNAYASFLLGTVPTVLMRSGDFSYLVGYPSTYPYIPPAPAATFCGSTTYPISVREYLNLTDAEVTATFNQSAAYNDYYVRKQNRISDVYVEIRDETAKPSPDPLALGLRYSELAGIGQEIQAAGTQLVQAARAVLNPQQSAQVKVLQDDQNLQPVASQAQACNLLVLAPGTASNVAVYTGLLSFNGSSGSSYAYFSSGLPCLL